MENSTKLLITNTVWFILFGTLIYLKDLSLWWFLFPVAFHWRETDL